MPLLGAAATTTVINTVIAGAVGAGLSAAVVVTGVHQAKAQADPQHQVSNSELAQYDSK